MIKRTAEITGSDRQKGACSMEKRMVLLKTNKHLLIAVDEADSSRRAVQYVADMLGGAPGFTVTLLSVVPSPEADFFDTEGEMHAWLKKKTDEANAVLEKYRGMLVQAGFPEHSVDYCACVEKGRSLSDAILETRCDRCTLVVGRSHKSKDEEFLFGSTSSRLIHESKNRAVWVVE
jgi:nucleotide-binding universal stress UspA family protein